jgi:tRNA(adenine34) deaminase
MDASRHREYMKLAIEQAKIAYSLGEVPIGAVIVKDDVVIATSYNQTEKNQNPLGHAELLAIDIASKKLHSRRLIDCTLYVTLEPCPMCAGAILLSRIPTVYFASKDAKSGAVQSLYELLHDKRLNHQCEVHEGIMTRESTELLSTFFKQLREGKISKTKDIGIKSET